MHGRLAIMWAGPLLLVLGLLLWWVTRPGPPAVPSDQMEYHPVPFAALKGWEQDDHGAALAAFLRSCGRIGTWPADRPLSGRDGVAGRAGDWAGVCRTAQAIAPEKPDLARRFFEDQFRAVLGGVSKNFKIHPIRT